jgi:hypothetical protein
VQPQSVAAPTASNPSYGETEPPAPITYSQEQGQPAALAPLSYPEQQVQRTVPVEEKNLMQHSPNLKFRPLEKQGYSSELEE